MDGLHENVPSVASLVANTPPPFLSKTYDMVDDPSTNAVVSWGSNGNSFVVWNVPEFSKELLPKCFKHNNFSSFVRQLNTYGFRKVDSDRWEFANEGFLKGQKHLLKSISRRKPAQGQSHQQAPQVQTAPGGSCVEVGKIGIDEEVESLKRDKNVLMQELVRLRQQQQTTDTQLQTVGNRVQSMEQRQQHMMSFLAKAMQSPGFLTQLVQQQNDSGSRRISGVSKKRRLPRQEEENFLAKVNPISPNGQIVKYQPLMNEAAKAMLRQILQINDSSRLEQKINNSSGFFIDNVPSPSNAVVDSTSSSNRLSGVTLSEVLSTPSSTLSEIKSPDTNMLNFQDETLPDFSEITEFMDGNSISISELDFNVSKNDDAGIMDTNIDTLPEFVDSGINAAPDGFSSDPDVDALLDEIPKLPGINDVFWEQFLSTSPLTGDSDEIPKLPGINDVFWEQFLSTSPLTEDSDEIIKDDDDQSGAVEESGWEKNNHMIHLTKQLGLLASGSSPV